MRINVLLKKIYNLWSCPDATLRRDPINIKMFDINDQGYNCLSCTGVCCTFENNSMQIDPLQAIEILSYLESKGRLDQIVPILQENIKSFRLDKEVTDGKGRVLRRFYTCPFFKNESCGCSIGTKYKPYGCLAFNPLEKEITNGGKCRSDIEVLSNREKQFDHEEELVNNFLRENLQIYWIKTSIPVALLELLDKIEKWDYNFK